MAEQPTVFFVDDDPKAGELMLRFSEGAAYRCRVFQDPDQALKAFRNERADMIVSDLRMPGVSGTELLAAVREIDSDVPFVVITGYANVDSAVEALRLGATDFIKKPFDMDEMRMLIERTLAHRALRAENQLLKRQLREERNRFGMVGQSAAMQEVYRIIEKIADVRCNVIIEGESGTGKELAARAIHYQSAYADRPFVVIDCGALTDSLLESELFGYRKGAFTGALNDKKGLLEQASGGTVFLDEIGNISDSMQIKLLRVVQEQQITRVGDVRPIDIDVRFIVASNRDLAAMVRDNSFRHDLYHRLNVVGLRMPSLRERRDDIPLLVQTFVERFAKQFHRDVDGFDSGSMRALTGYDWPGNVRELSNVVERHVALADTKLLHVEQLGAPESESELDADLPTLEELERRYILKVIEHFGGSREKTATTLGINKSTLWRKLQQYGYRGQ